MGLGKMRNSSVRVECHMNCYDCKFYNTDYEFDGEDEYEIGICEVGHNEYLNSDEECPYFKKYLQKKYVETDTECDVCEYLFDCMKLIWQHIKGWCEHES